MSYFVKHAEQRGNFIRVNQRVGEANKYEIINKNSSRD